MENVYRNAHTAIVDLPDSAHSKRGELGGPLSLSPDNGSLCYSDHG